jgi:small subunit ribosomal protein S21
MLLRLPERGEDIMPKVSVGENEPLEKALRRFKKKIEIEGILKTLKARKHYEKPSERKRRKRKMGWKAF